LDEAEKMHRKSLEIDEKRGRLEGMANAYSNLGVIYQTRGDPAGARELWVKARDLFAQIGMPHMVEMVQGWLDKLDQLSESSSD
ncbi:MAG: tetratricopeptide repeat protein, partial [Phycisphaeraceae bacterium]